MKWADFAMNAAHWHLTLNHLPVVGSAFALGLLGWAIFRRSQELKRVAFATISLVAVLTVPAYLTGEPAFMAAMEVLEATPADEDLLVEKHESAAGLAFAAAALAGGSALAGLIAYRGGKPLPDRLSIAVLALTAATVLLMARTANLGGAIRHPEIAPETAGKKN
jgi:uncharacterized membrane protein